MSQSFDHSDLGSRDVRCHVVATGNRDQWIVGAVQDQSGRLDRRQQRAPVTTGQKGSQLPRHSRRVETARMLFGEYLPQTLRTAREIGAGDSQLASEGIFDQRFLVTRRRQGDMRLVSDRVRCG